MSIPSLTPHRDAVEAALASVPPQAEPFNRLANEAVNQMHRLFADACDGGMDRLELFSSMPKLLRAFAINMCGHFGAENPRGTALLLLGAAMSESAAPGRVEMISATLAPQTSGGRA